MSTKKTVKKKPAPKKKTASKKAAAPDRRRDDGGAFLIVADGSDEFAVSLNYASLLGAAHHANIAVLYVMSKQGFQHWGTIEKRMRRDQRKEAESAMWEFAKKIYDLSGRMPALYFEEGGRLESVLKVLEDDKNIKKLILASRAHARNPGPLVSYFTGKGMQKLAVPLTVVPGHIGLHEIKKFI